MKVFVGGDLYIGKRLEPYLDQEPSLVLREALGWVRAADLAIVNLESPLCVGGRAIKKTGPNMRASPSTARFLKDSGFRLVALANNHIYDYGDEGLLETFEHLDAADLGSVGAGKTLEAARNPYVYERHGETIGILNFAENEWSTTNGPRPGANPVDPILNFYDIRALKERVDHVIVITHGGHETFDLPSSDMKKRLRFYVDAGADAVLNHHQHVVSGYEVYKSAPIFYGLGNFLFDNGPRNDSEWNRGLAVTLVFGKGEVAFQHHFFDQCGPEIGIRECGELESKNRWGQIEKINRVIEDVDILEQEFERFLLGKRKMYRSYLFPSSNRMLQFLYNRGWFPELMSRRKKRLYLNLIRCESHRDALCRVMEKEA